MQDSPQQQLTVVVVIAEKHIVLVVDLLQHRDVAFAVAVVLEKNTVFVELHMNVAFVAFVVAALDIVAVLVVVVVVLEMNMVLPMQNN